ncbi:uncharacterized protein LOC111064366 isoform X1 [Nilaparvata lugens]|uniref:uncharacterized protein LOC111064366 isoform X1 n=1 Tax=Nilaparvata lugens TaxID=108931 RepID=UPI00193D898B|nr:uncharacterized protein LOC111064366 isoform X1 [Nilaparvata lugens]
MPSPCKSGLHILKVEASEETQARALLLLRRVVNSDAQFYSQFFSREQDGVLACHHHANRASIFSRYQNILHSVDGQIESVNIKSHRVCYPVSILHLTIVTEHPTS